MKLLSSQQNWCMCISIVISCLKHCWNTLNFPKLGIQTNPCSSPCVLWWEKSGWKHCWLPTIKPCSVLGPLKNFLFGGTSCPSGCLGQPSLCPLGREEWAGNVGQCLPNTEGRGWGKSSDTQSSSEHPACGEQIAQGHRITSGSCHKEREVQNCAPWLSVADGWVSGGAAGRQQGFGASSAGKSRAQAVLDLLPLL